MTDKMKYRLSTSQEKVGYTYVNGRPHGFLLEKRYEVTFKFETLEERKQFIKKAKGLLD